jgi:hypothetical protein
MNDLTAQVQATVPALHLARPAFCRFAEMNGFPGIGVVTGFYTAL